MSESAGFYAFLDPVAKTGGTLFPFDPVTGLVSCPNGASNISLPVADLPRVIAAVRRVCDQETADLTIEPTEVVAKADGSGPLISIVGTVVYAPPAAPTLSQVTIGNPYPLVKARDWAAGAEKWVLGITPPTP